MKTSGKHRLLKSFALLPALLILASLNSCGFWDAQSTEPEITVAVNVDGLTPDMSSLVVSNTLNGQPAMGNQQISGRLDRFAIALPLDKTGTLVITAVAHSADNCAVATGTVTVTITPPPPTRYEVSLSLVPTPAGAGKQCALTVSVFGKGSVTSQPPGISCVGAGKLVGSVDCTADFPVGTQIMLTETHDARTYGVAWDGLCTSGPCSFKFNASGKVLTGFGARGCSKDNWCFHNPLPQGNNMNAVWGAANNDVWAVGDAGTFLHYDGMTWSSIGNLGDVTSANLYGLYGTSTSDIWAVGDTGTILHYDGKAWTASPQSTIVTTQQLRAVWGSGPSDYWAVGLGTTLLHYDGNAWSVAAVPTGVSASFYGLWGSGPSDVIAVGSAGNIIHYKVTGGNTTPVWVSEKIVTSATFYAVSGSAANQVWAVGYFFTPFGLPPYQPAAYSYDGKGWTSNTTGTFGLRRPTAVWVAPNGKAWAGGNGTTGLAAPAYFDGSMWTTTDLKTLTVAGGNLNGIFGLSEGDVWGVGTGGLMFHFDGGAWTPARLAAGYNSQGLNSVWGNGPSDVWAVGDLGTIRRFDGTSWKDSTQSGVVTTSYLQQVWGANPNFVLASGSGSPSVVLRYDGTTWSVVPWTGTTTTQYLYGMWGIASPPTVQIVGGYGTLATYNGTNLTLSNQSYPIASSTTTPPQLTTNYMNAAWGTSSSVYAVGDGGMIIYGSGNSWFEQTGSRTVTTNSLQGLWGTATNNIWAVGYSGTILHYNGTWSLDAASTNGTTTTNDSFSNIWISPQIGWIVGYSGVVFRYNGSQWARVNSGTKNSLYGVWGATMTDAWAVGAGGLTMRYQP